MLIIVRSGGELIGAEVPAQGVFGDPVTQNKGITRGKNNVLLRCDIELRVPKVGGFGDCRTLKVGGVEGAQFGRLRSICVALCGDGKPSRSLPWFV